MAADAHEQHKHKSLQEDFLALCHTHAEVGGCGGLKL